MNEWFWSQTWPCVCNRGDRWLHTHYPERPHKCARCTECKAYREDIPEHLAIRILIGPEMTEREGIAILIGHDD